MRTIRTSLMWAYFFGIPIIAFFILFGCGTEKVRIEGLAGKDGIDGIQGETGVKGIDGKDGVLLSIVSIPDKGECVFLGRNRDLLPVWVENEGGHADYYNNDRCDHGPSPLSEYCNDIPESSKHCWVGNFLFFTVGKQSEMKVHMLDYNDR